MASACELGVFRRISAADSPLCVNRRLWSLTKNNFIKYVYPYEIDFLPECPCQKARVVAKSVLYHADNVQKRSESKHSLKQAHCCVIHCRVWGPERGVPRMFIAEAALHYRQKASKSAS
jgi:hypothetical protein